MIMVVHRKRAITVTSSLLTAFLCFSCAHEPLAPDVFTLTEDSAMIRVMSTKRVANLSRAIPNRRITCMVEHTTPDAVYLYLGDDEGDHTTRVGFYRVTRDGRVWMNRDETGLYERWAVIE